MVTPKLTENAHKVAYLVEQYPEHTLTQILGLLQLSSIDKNAAVWTARDLGLISEPDPETKRVALLEKPKQWVFGQDEYDLEQLILFAFRQLAKQETDLEEVYLANWTYGYPAHDVLVAEKRLTECGLLATYVIEDSDSTYTFFTLNENKDKLWGRKQFKKDPLATSESKTK